VTRELGDELLRLKEASLRATGSLGQPEWRPTRAHFEGLRNTVNGAIRAISSALRPQAPASGASDLRAYDAGLLNDFGGGNVDWWQDYIRAELARAHDHYEAEAADALASARAEIAGLKQRIADGIASFAADPPDSDHQRGYLAALEELAK
jgi:hypothetical protein